MKQYWRVGTIRAIVGVILGMLVLGRYYYKFIPYFNSLSPSILGAILLAGVFLIVFLIAGYIYDVKAALWNEQTQITTEKNPWQYVPQPRLFQIEYPIFYVMFDTLRQLFTKKGISTQKIDETVMYLDEYFNRLPDRRSDLLNAEAIAADFMRDHPFIESSSTQLHIRLRTRIKRSFQLHVWRLTWVQGLTGLAQDVLVFAALYIAVLFPNEVTETGGVSIELLLLGILFISMPLYFGLVISGYYYDKKLRMWSPDMVVKFERTPYSYVPSPRVLTFATPFFYAMITIYYDLFAKRGLDTSELERLITYLDTFVDLRPEEASHIDYAKKLRSDYGPLFSKHGDV